MLFLGLLLFSVTAAAAWCPIDPSFPPQFKLGAATSSYQIEGAWNVSDKGESIWDAFVHNNPDAIKDQSTGDVACDSYHLWEKDIEMACEMGLDFYRFSISWPRLLPKGFDYYVSEDGAKYYNDLINGLLACGIEPVITLHHWELPEVLQQLGGWTNPLTADYFANYARVVFSLYGDRVKTWLTINEPIIMCDLAYNTGAVAPGILEPYLAPFLCAKIVLLAHAQAWRIYDEEFKPLYYGKVSIANQVVWYEPKSPEYSGLAEMALQFVVGKYYHAIYSKTGGWPPGLEEAMAAESARMGYPRSRLPVFTDSEKELIRGTYDFMAINYYTSKLIRPATVGEQVEPNFFIGVPELDAVAEPHPTATFGVVEAVAVYPEGLRMILGWLKASYGDIEMIITENGYSTLGNDLDDSARVTFIRDHLEQVLLAMQLDSIPVSGYTYWTIMDNFEWTDGYITKYGIYEVNFTDPLRTRTPRASARYYSNVIKHRQLDIC